MTVEIAPLIITNEQIDAYREMFGGRADPALAREITQVIGQDFADRPDYLTYEGLRRGTAGIFDDDPEQASLSPNERALSDEQIILNFTNAEDPSYLRAFTSEFAKTLPGVYAGTKVAGQVGSRIIPPAVITGNPLAIGGALAITGASAIVPSILTYEAADYIEDAIYDPAAPIPPSMRPGYELVRTLGGGAAGVFMPWMMPKTVDLGAKTLLTNMQDGAKQPLLVRTVAFLEDAIPGTRKAAQQFPKTTIAAEGAGVAGSAVGAGLAERVDPGGTGVRLLSELVFGNIAPITVLKAIGPIGTQATELSDAEKTILDSLADKVVDSKQQKLFERINEIYSKFGTEESYEELIAALGSPEVRADFEAAFPNIDFTAAQRTGDPIIMGIEAQKASGNEDLDAARQKAQREAGQFTYNFIKSLEELGDPESVRQAAQLREAYYIDLLESRLAFNLSRQAQAIDKLIAQTEDATDEDRVIQLNKNFAKIFEESISAWRTQESTNWDKVGNPVLFEGVALGTRPITRFGENNIKSSAYGPTPVPIIDDTGQFLPKEGANRDLWNLEAIYERADIPAFIRYFDDLVYELPNDASRKAFLNNPQIKEISDFVEDSRKHLGLKIKNDPRNDFTERLYFEPEPEDGKISADALSVLEVDDTDLRPITMKQLTSIRGRALSAARKLSAGENADRDFARLIGGFADAVLEDLDDAAVAVEGNVSIPVKKVIEANEDYDNARAFSRAGNDVFRRSILGKYSQTKATGADVLTPELYLDQLFFNSNAGLTYSRLQEIRAFSTFMDEQLGQPDVFINVDDTLDKYLRTVRGVTAVGRENPKTGELVYTVNPDKLREWREANAEILEFFPQLKLDLADAQSAQRLFNIFEQRRKSTEKVHQNQKYLADLLGGVAPSIRIEEALNDPKNATKELIKLFNLGPRTGRTPREVRAGLTENEYTKSLERIAKIRGAEIAPEDVAAGFRSAILDYALRVGGGEGTIVNPKAIYQALFGPIKRETATSLMDVASQERFEIFSPEETNRLKFMLTQLIRVQAADEAGRLSDPAVAEASGAFVDFYLGIAGSAAGTTAYSALVPGGSGPGSITAAGIGRRQMLEAFKEVPASKRMDLLDTMFTDPELVAMLLRKPTSDQQRQAQSNRVLRFLENKGFTTTMEMSPFLLREAAEDEDQPDPEILEQLQTLPREDRRALARPLSAVTTPTPVTAPAPSPVRPVVSAPLQPRPTIASAPQQPVDRARFAALFPNDSASAMIRQQTANQGIGSLMG